MNNESKSIKWSRQSKKHSHIHYDNQILFHNNHISVSKTMVVNGESKGFDLCHIPYGVIKDVVKEIERDENSI